MSGRSPQHAPVTERRRPAPASAARSTASSPPPVRPLQARLGNQGAQAVIAAAQASARASKPADRPVKVVERLPTIPDPDVQYVVRPPEKRYNFSANLHWKPIVFHGLTPEQVVQRLLWLWRFCHNDLDEGRAWTEHLIQRRKEHWVVGFWADTFGGADLPDPDMWNVVGRGSLAQVKQVLDATDQALHSRWQVNEASMDRNLAPGLENNPYIKAAIGFDATEQRIRGAVALLEKAALELQDCQRIVDRYVKDSNRGAERAITGIKVTIVVLGAAATGGGASFAGKGAGLAAQSGASALTAGGLGVAEETFTQVGEMRIGVREDWDFDFKRIAIRGVTDTIQGFIGGIVAGKFSKVLKGRLGGWVGGLSDETLAAHGITRADLLTRGQAMFIDWVAGVGASPVTTLSGQLMRRAIEGKWQVQSFDDFAGLMFDEMVKTGTMSIFLNYGGHALSSSRTSATTASSPSAATIKASSPPPPARPPAQTIKASPPPPPGRPPARTIKASPPPPPARPPVATAAGPRRGPPAAVTDVEIIASNVRDRSLIKPQDPKSHQAKWQELGGSHTETAPQAYRDSDGNIRVSTDHILLASPRGGGIPPVSPRSPATPPHKIPPSRRAPVAAKPDLGTADTGQMPAVSRAVPDPLAKTPAAPVPADQKAPAVSGAVPDPLAKTPAAPAPAAQQAPSPKRGKDTAAASEESKQPMAPPRRGARFYPKDPPQPVSCEVVERMGSRATFTIDKERHQQGWELVGGRGEAPPAFISENKVYLDPSRWPPDTK